MLFILAMAGSKIVRSTIDSIEHLTSLETAIIRTCVYEGTVVSTVESKGNDLGHEVLLIPDELKSIYSKKKHATLSLLKEIIKGARPIDSQLAGAFALGLAENPMIGYQVCGSTDGFDNVIRSQQATPRSLLAEQIETLLTEK